MKTPARSLPRIALGKERALIPMFARADFSTKRR
jgi:hypothetical protein